MLDSFGFSQSLIDDLCTFLDNGSTVLTASRPEGVGESFGVSPASTGCASDAGLAKDKVVAAITDMSAGLQTFRSAMDQMRKSALEVEDVTEASLTKQFQAAEACQSPTFAAVSTCSPLGGGEGA